METLLTEALAQIALAVLTLVLTGAVAFVTPKIRAVLQSREVRNYGEALQRFDAGIYGAVVDFARAAEVKIRDTADELVEGERYRFVYEAAATYINTYAARTGVKTAFTDRQIQALVKTAVDDVREEMRRRRDARPLAPPMPSAQPGQK